MGTRTRRRFTAEYKERTVARLSESGATTSGVAGELGITPTQLKTWRLEQEAAGSAEAVAQQKAEAADLRQLRRDVKALTATRAAPAARGRPREGRCRLSS